jgi:hypothetical protein
MTIRQLGALPIGEGVRELAQRGYSAKNADGFTNGVHQDLLPQFVAFAAKHGLRPFDAHIANFWGRCHVRPHRDSIDCDRQLLWAIRWGAETEFYSGNVALALASGNVYLFHSQRDLHGIYTARAQLWSCFVMDVEPL